MLRTLVFPQSGNAGIGGFIPSPPSDGQAKWGSQTPFEIPRPLHSVSPVAIPFSLSEVDHPAESRDNLESSGLVLAIGLSHRIMLSNTHPPLQE